MRRAWEMRRGKQLQPEGDEFARSGSADPLPVAGSARTALFFDGKDDYALVKRFRGLPSRNISVAAWVRVLNMKSFNRIVSHKWVTNGWNLYVDQSGVARFGIGQNNKDFAASKIMFRNRWHYVCGTYDGEFIRVYVDGSEGAKTRLDNAELDTEGYLSIGGAEWDPFHGAIDEVRVWNQWRSREDVRSDMVEPPMGDEEGLVGYWKFDEGGGHTSYDSTLNRNHAVLGTARRMPSWIASSAPVSVPCAVKGEAITLLLDGMAGGGVEPRVMITELPATGTLYQTPADGGALPQEERRIWSVPAEVRDGSSFVIFAPPDGVGRGTECAIIKYKVHDGKKTSEIPAVLFVDIVDKEEERATRSRLRDAGSCWAVRTQLDYVKAREKPPRVSVIIPVYNAGGDLPETVASVVAQNFTDWEIIMVDDGSTDGESPTVIQSLIRKYNNHRLRVVRKPNGGLADARNAGIMAARADWVFPLDADDIITPDFLERAVSILDNDKDANLVIADLKGFGAWEYSWRLPEYDALDLRYANMFHCSAIFPKSLWTAAGGYPTTTLFGYEDWAFWIRVTETGEIRPRRIAEDLFLYRISPQSMHRSLLSHQDYSLASLRLLFPSLYPVELLLAAHETLMASPDRVVKAVDEKVLKFPMQAAAYLMRGLIREGIAAEDISHDGSHFEGALEDYQTAASLASHQDWQPLWRLGLLEKRMGHCGAANITLHRLFHSYTTPDALRTIHIGPLAGGICL